MKKTTKILCCVLGLGFLLTGCATVGGIKNSDEELIYNGNSAVMVDGYLYYGNAFADISTFTDDGSYKSSAKLSYLARLNTNVELASKTYDYSPKGVEKVSEEVVGYSKDTMFALGNYIYYATPNRQKAEDENGEAKNYYNYTTFYRSELNGNHKTKFYTSSSEITDMQVLKYDGKYYIVMLENKKIIKIQIGDKLGKAETLAEDVTSMAIPKTYQKDKKGSTLDFNGNIYYTTERKDEDNSDVTGTIVNRIKINESESKKIDAFAETITFIGRERDILFFTRSENGNTVVFQADATKLSESNLIRNATRFYNGSVSDLRMIASNADDYYGFLFYNSSSELMYAKKGSTAVKLTFNNGEETISGYKILIVTDRTVILSTTTAIYRADLGSMENGNVPCLTIVTMTAIYDGTLYAYDGKYIYYYAKLETLELDEDEQKEADKEEADDNYYLYRAKVGVNPNNPSLTPYELLGLTKLNWRKTK